jgi:hypothetical protein
MSERFDEKDELPGLDPGPFMRWPGPELLKSTLGPNEVPGSFPKTEIAQSTQTTTLLKGSTDRPSNSDLGIQRMNFQGV